MNVRVRPASLQDGVAVLELLEEVGYYPEPIAFAKTYRKTLSDGLTFLESEIQALTPRASAG